jgi:eukaryotic-like serine/threonine-protein kinase
MARIVDCRSCGRVNQDTAKFCRGCGAPLHADVECQRCGASNLTDSSFCSECGSPLSSSIVQQSAQATTPRAAGRELFANGRYAIVSSLGEGGRKRVYRARDTRLERDVAFALISTEGLDAVGRERLRREARAMARLGDHPNVVTVFDIGEDENHPYLVSQLMTGGDLASRLNSAPDHRLSLEEALSLAGQVCRALSHAHEHGIVHRDLKPGNIWLAEDGTAKLGDFGLAVALDQTRHTEPGMMVGTVSYMAPEQAIGAAVDARVDLYALGCVLYELVCGRPPFVGDESVAIITQHLNTPPVAPSWHRPDCPPGLEALILRLLEKDPDKRPASAAEIRAALESVKLAPVLGSAESASAEDASAGSPLYRRAFVGRESELGQLQAAFDAGLSGHGGLAMVVGEPGIGKTSLCEQLATYVTVRGGRALIGHCYEEGSLSLPYLPLVEAMRSYVLAREPDGLRSDLGSGAEDVARIVSEVRDRVAVSERTVGNPEEERWRLFQSVSGFLRNASLVQPLLIVLEDLHDADRGTLDLLVHLARNLEGARLLLVGTYRDIEVDRSHPLSSALAELRRGASFSRVPLRGLTPDEVQRMMASVSQREIPWLLSELVHRQTEGNPLFVQEMLRYLVEQGLVESREGTLQRVGQESLADRIPEGLRDVIGKRLSQLSETTNQVLAVAAIIGREFRLDVLQQVAGVPDDDLFTSLKQALAVAVVEERPAQAAVIVYRFTHAFFSQTLYEETIAPLRIRRHQQVARALEDIYGPRVVEHAAELAEHYSHSSNSGDLAKAVAFGERAARRSMQVFAYGEAVRHLEQALQVQQVLDPDDRSRRCELLLAVGEALMPAGDPERAFRIVAEEAYALSAQIGDSPRACSACRIALEAQFQYGQASTSGTGGEDYRRWAQRLDAHARPGTADRVYADYSLAWVSRQAGRHEETWRLEVQAFRTAQDLGDEDALVGAALAVALGQSAPVADLRLRYDGAIALMAGSFPHTARSILALAMHWTQSALLTWADRERAAEGYRRLEDIAERSRDPSAYESVLLWQAMYATWDGHLERALEIADEIVLHGQQTGREINARQLGGRARRRALFFLGRCEDILASLPNPDHIWDQGGVFSSQQAVYLAHVGRTDEARVLIDKFLDDPDVPASDSRTPATILRLLLEAAVVTGYRDTAAIFEPMVAPMADMLFTEPDMTYCVGRNLGGAAQLLGQTERAREYYERGIAACERDQHRPELALCRLELAELILSHYPAERGEAMKLLDSVVGDFRVMHMQTFLERALRRKLQTQGVDLNSPATSVDIVARAVETERPNIQQHAAPDGTVTLLFSDIEDSTGMTVRLGDQRWLEVLRSHHALVRDQIRAHAGFEVKCQGDGFMLAFQSARRALDCAVAIQRGVDAANKSHSDTPIRVRIGLHTGEALKEVDDFHGRDVVLAARIANEARGREILVSSLLKELTESNSAVHFDEGRHVELRGLQGTHRVYSVRWEEPFAHQP